MDVPSQAEIIAQIDVFMARYGVAETTFGREATGEPALLSTLRAGRSPSLKTLQRISAYMIAKAADHSATDTTADAPASSGKTDENSPERAAA